jgi:tellurite resistance protein
MSEHGLSERERALENAFFARQNEALLAKLRAADATKSRKEALAAASGITDDTVLTHLADLKLGPQGVAALGLVPMVIVAWADGTLDPKEKQAVLRAAQEAGLDSQPEARTLLDGWLAAPPGRELAEAWTGYVRAVAPGLGADGRAALQRETIGRARRVAEAAGGFLGLGSKISDAEAQARARREEAFTG